MVLLALCEELRRPFFNHSWLQKWHEHESAVLVEAAAKRLITQGQSEGASAALKWFAFTLFSYHGEREKRDINAGGVMCC